MDVMVGRDAPLAAADAALAGALSGAGGLLLISGEAGIGKTRLAQEIVQRAAGRGVPQAWGPAVDDHGAPPLWPWRRALREMAGAGTLVDARQTVGGPAPDPSARFQLFTEICDVLVGQAEGSGLVLVLEDMHWADAASLALLEQVATDLPRSRLLIVVTYRPGPALDATLSRLIRGPGVTHLSLAGLTSTDIDRWLRTLAGDAAIASLAVDLRDRTGGNPLLVRLVTQALCTGSARADGQALDVLLTERPDIRRLIASRTSTLSPGARDVVDGASVLGERSPLVTLTTLIGVHDRPATELLSEAIGAGVLRETPDAAGSIEFTHALVRDAVYADLSPVGRAEWHRRCATALEMADPAAPAGIVAGHWQRAAGADAQTHCLAWARAAADEAEASFAFQDACRFTELAVRCATELRTPDADIAALTVRLAELQFAAGNIDASLAACGRASDIAARAGRPELMAAAGLVVQGIGTPDVNRRIRQLCRRALAAVGDEPTAVRARLLAHIAAATAEDEGGPLAERLSADALAAAEETGDATAIVEAIAARHLAIAVPDTVAQRLELGRRAVDLGASSKQPLAALWGHLWRVDAAFQLGNIAEVDREVAEIDRIATDRRSALARWHWHRLHATRAALLGDFASAREHNGEAGALATRMGDLSLAGMSYAFSSQLAVVRGDVSELPEGFRTMIDRMPRMPLVLIAVVITSALAGDIPAARASFESFREVPETFPYGTKWAGTLGQIGVAAVLLDDAAVAGAVYTAMARTALYYTGDGSGALYSHGANAGVLGAFALTAGRVDDAIPLLRDGIAMNARIGARPAAALTRLGLAMALRARSDATEHHPRGRDDDFESARALAAESAAEFRRLDMPGPLARAQALSISLAVSSAPVLSTRETEIAGLVAETLSNRAIAERLFLSERTVESHVRSILNKLGFTSRTEIALWAADRQRRTSTDVIA